MKRKNATRNALFTSIISLLLCVSMLVGTTFAWFTDEVVSGTNVIAAGNLDVELFYSKTKNFDNAEKVDNATLLFTDKDGNEIEQWEPGVVAYTNLQVANVGTLALTYRMSLIFDNMNTVIYEGTEYDLSDVLKVAIVEGGFEGTRADAQKLENYDALDSFHLEGELEGDTKTETIGVVIYWKPGNNDNIWNITKDKTTSDDEPLHVNLGINLFATQEEYEEDSFDDTYDEPADNIIAAGETVRYDEPGQEITESFLNNGTLIIEGGAVNNDSYALENRGTANLEKVKVEAGNATNYALISRGPGAVTTLDEVALTSHGGAIAAAGGATVIVNSGDYKVYSASTSGRYVIYTEGAGARVIVNGGTFSWDKNDNQKRAYVHAGAGTTVEINGGTFGKASTRSGYTDGIMGTGEVIIKGGTFGFNPSKWVALGYEAVKSGDTWTVSPIAPVTTDAELQAAITAGNTTIVLADGEYNVDFYSITERDTLNIVGQGADTKVKFSNLQVRASQFKNLTISNCTIERMPDKSWGHLVFGSSTEAGGVYTISNCVFNGVGSQGIYINQNVEATFNIENCTFNGDFGGEGAITIQNNEGVNVTVNVTGCTFNNVSEVSHEIYVLYEYNGWTLNADGVEAYWKTNS